MGRGRACFAFEQSSSVSRPHGFWAACGIAHGQYSSLSLEVLCIGVSQDILSKEVGGGGRSQSYMRGSNVLSHAGRGGGLLHCVQTVSLWILELGV